MECRYAQKERERLEKEVTYVSEGSVSNDDDGCGSAPFKEELKNSTSSYISVIGKRGKS